MTVFLEQPLIAQAIDAPPPQARARMVRELREQRSRPLLVLDTCQRLEVFGANEALDATASQGQWKDHEALERLARIGAGLESRVLGELEVLGQFREAYKAFQERHGATHRRLNRIFQDALALARKARRESGIDRNLISLGALAAREMIERVGDAPVAVVGSGSLAQSVARYLGKRGEMPVRISSRCPENALKLATEVQGFASGLDELAHQFSEVAGIITATAAPHPLVYPHQLASACEKVLIIDLGEPPDCSFEVPLLDQVEYISLIEVEQRAQVNSEDRARRGQDAARIIRDVAASYGQASPRA